MAELSPAFIFATVYVFQSYITWLMSNHDHQIMSENPGVYMAMKSAVSVHPLIEKNRAWKWLKSWVSYGITTHKPQNKEIIDHN